MAFITLNTLVTDPFVAALCNTLVHSLWQGLVLAALTGFIIILTRRASAATRYNLLIAALALFAVGVSLTFITEFKKANATAATTVQALPFNNTAPIISNNGDITFSANIVPPANATFSDQFFNYLNQNHNTIVLIWFLIICAKSIQLAVGLWGVHRLKTKQVSAVSAFWDDKLKQLANSLAIQQTISLLESGLTKVPMVIGNLKPVVLIPIGLLTALSTEEVEAILVHELAHIKRRDYLVNLLQSLMEIVFFFNPAVLWISQLIKAERENCCDDLALAQSSNKVNYIRALVSCEEYQQSVPAYAMAFPGGKSSLIDRVKRIAGNRNHSLNLFEKTVLAICLVVFGLGMSAYAEKDNIKRAAHAVVKAIQHIKENVAPTQTTVAAKEDPAIKISASPILSAEMPSLHDAITIQKLDTDTVTRLKLGSLKPITGRLKRITVNPGYIDTAYRERQELKRWQLEEMANDGFMKPNAPFSYILNEKEFVVNGVKQSEETHQKYWAPQKAYLYIHGINDSLKRAAEYALDKARGQLFTDEMVKDGLWVRNTRGNSYSINEKEFIINGVKQPENIHQKYLPMATFRAMTTPRDPERRIIDSIRSAQSRVRTSTAINEMLKEGLAKNRATLSFRMSDTAFIINGVKQPEDVHKKYFEIMRGYQYKPVVFNTNINLKTDIKTNAVNATTKINVNVDNNSRVETLRYSPSISFQNKNGERSTYKGNMNMIYKPGRATYSARAPYRPDSSAKLNLTNKLNLKLNIPSMADALYKAGLIKDKTKFTARITNDDLIVNGVKQSEENHQKILKLYQKKPGDNINLSFTYPDTGK
jgi:bla regulator protein BlaR1